jgi:hypothetical protein
MILIAAFIGALLPTLSAKSMTATRRSGTRVGGRPARDEYGIVFARLRARGHARRRSVARVVRVVGGDAVDEKGEPITPDHPIVAQLLDDLRRGRRRIRRSGSGSAPSTSRRSCGRWARASSRSSGSGSATGPTSTRTATRRSALDGVGRARRREVEARGPGRARVRRVAEPCDGVDQRRRPPRDGLWHGEVIEQRRGTGWIVDSGCWSSTAARAGRDPLRHGEPGGVARPELEKAGVTVTPVTAASTRRRAGCSSTRRAGDGAASRPATSCARR